MAHHQGGKGIMAVKKIYCQDCKAYLGEIREATLKKGMVFLCRNCELKRRVSKADIGNFLDKLMDGRLK